jgi:DNA-binding response OmpR family regulator
MFSRAELRHKVLEDDRAIAGLVRNILAREAFEVEVVGNAPAAIERVSSDRYDLLVLDLMVPDHGGDVIDYFKRHRLEALRSVIVVTAVPDVIPEALRGEYPEPVCKFIAKPFDVADFVRLVHACKELCGGSRV